MTVLTVDVEPDFPPYLNTCMGLKGLKYLAGILSKHGCGATFFVTARFLDQNPEMLE